jgi:hypothetical protein
VRPYGPFSNDADARSSAKTLVGFRTAMILVGPVGLQCS